MNKKQGTTKIRSRYTVIKPVWWRQFAFSSFLLVTAVFFAFLDDFGLVVGWLGTILFLLLALLNFLDQAFTWSRLRIDRHGYHLRSWWHRQKYQHHEIEDFELDEYAKRKLIMIRFRDTKGESEYGEDHRVPFPCTFGRSPDDVFKTLRSNLVKGAVSKT